MSDAESGGGGGTSVPADPKDQPEEEVNENIGSVTTDENEDSVGGGSPVVRDDVEKALSSVHSWGEIEEEEAARDESSPLDALPCAW
eukprot:CAMPEP_0113564256 /NCGR_PEP_ID=MMETSP0015_2-20120614/21520_1 /TAXON_ID=2838 /ORGANISM="Odontella" /LENGTH=86 /DNA_ID=CAMNT_0000466321 /DNA_START=54 /DNA_END=311 /DNA_ORIENTATION=- /assembly_acc=CAM_ASM_000160